MPKNPTLSIRQSNPINGKYLIRLTLKRPGRPELEAEASIEFALTPKEQEDLRWYLEDYLQRAASVEKVHIEQIEILMKQRGEELYTKILTANQNTQAIWFATREQLADLRIEINTGIAEAASIPWELMRDPQSDSPIALRVKSFVRVQSNPNLSFVPVPEASEGRVRLLYVVCRPGGTHDVPLRAIANRLLQDLGEDLARFDIMVLRPPTFEQLQKELTDAKEEGHPYHIVHFDGHGIYADLSKTTPAWWRTHLSSIMLGGEKSGKHGYLLFEHPGSDNNMRPVRGDELGQLLHDTGVPILVLNACQSAMQEANVAPNQAVTVHEAISTIGSLAQAVIDQGIPAILGMRYSVFVVTAAQYIGELYAALAKGREFGQAATESRKHLHRNPDRWIGLQPRPLQDWFVPVIYEAMPLALLPSKNPLLIDQKPEMDPLQRNPALRRYVPDLGFIGRDETILMLDRAFDDHPIVLLHAYAGQGKTTTAVEFGRWYAQTGGLGPQPVVLFTSFESHTDLGNVLNQIGQNFAPILRASGIEWHALNDPAERRRLVLKLLRQSPMLWIWDNVEPVAGFPEGTESAWSAAEQAELADFLKQLKLDKKTKVKILLTSRREEQQWLGGFLHRVKMPRMSPADAASLALQLGKEKNLRRSEIANWQPLLDYCAGNPMTLLIIASQAISMALRGEKQIKQFIQALRNGEQRIDDLEDDQARDKSLGASLGYGFRNAFTEDELPVIALLCLFQGIVGVHVLEIMGVIDHALPEVRGKNKDQLTRMLETARDNGLLTYLDSNCYTIHPALPWFLQQLFVEHYDGQDGRSSTEEALRVWVDTFAFLSNYYRQLFYKGDPNVIQILGFEEANLLHAHRIARRHRWWSQAIIAMQGLQALYEHQGSLSQWNRLVAEIVPDYCTEDDEPISGREDVYSHVIAYRAQLAADYDRDFVRAAALQEKLIKINRQRAAAALALPKEAPLDANQQNNLLNLGLSVSGLGYILSNQGNSDCVKAFQESTSIFQLIGDTSYEALGYYNLGHAYKDIQDIRDMDAAEAHYRRSLALREPHNALDRSRCIKQIGMVHYLRLEEALLKGESQESLLRHAQTAEQYYRQALHICPASAISDLGHIHMQLGNLYSQVGQAERGQKHFETCVQICDQTGERYAAGGARYNIALWYAQAAEQEKNTIQQRDDTLLRAKAYAQAALRDFQHYKGSAAAKETKAQKLLDEIEQTRARLQPQRMSGP